MYIDRYDILFNMLNQHTLVHIRINLLKPGIDKVVWVVSAVSKFCSKFWKDCYDSKTDATWRLTQRSIYFKNLENCLFPKLGVIQKMLVQNGIFLNPTPSNITLWIFFFTKALLFSHSLKHNDKSWHESEIWRRSWRTIVVIPQHDYLCETSLKANVATDKGKDRNETWTLNKEMKLEQLYKVASVNELNSWPDNSVG